MSLESQNRHPDWVRGLRIVITGAAGVLGNGLVEEASRQGDASHPAIKSEF